MEAPKCRLCEKNHWAREGCDFGRKNNGVAGVPASTQSATADLRRPVKTRPPRPKANISREGRRVLKGSTGKPAKPTRTASAERTDPPMPAKAPADRAIAEKAGVGIPKPRRKKKAKKAVKKKSKPPQESTR